MCVCCLLCACIIFSKIAQKFECAIAQYGPREQQSCFFVSLLPAIDIIVYHEFWMFGVLKFHIITRFASQQKCLNLNQQQKYVLLLFMCFIYLYIL